MSNQLVISLEELYPHLVAHSLESCVREDENGNLTIDYPVATLSDGVNALNIVEAGLVEYILEAQEEKLSSQAINSMKTAFTAIKTLKKELGYKSRENTLLKNRLERQEEKHKEAMEKAQKEYEKALKENEQYVEWYGKLLSPILLIKELYNNGAVAQWGFLIPRSQWKVARLKNSSTEKAVRYWLSQFEEWEIFRTYPRHKRLALVTMSEAFEMLYKHKERLKEVNEETNEINESNSHSK